MYGLNAFALILFGITGVTSVRLSRCPARVREWTLRVVCAALLLANLARYLLPPLMGGAVKIPVEFSAVAYFAVPAALLRWKKMQGWAVYSGLMAGFFYYLVMIAAGGVIYQALPAGEIYLSMFCHGALYLCGIVITATRRCSESDGYQLALGVGVVALHALILRPVAQEQQKKAGIHADTGLLQDTDQASLEYATAIFAAACALL